VAQGADLGVVEAAKLAMATVVEADAEEEVAEVPELHPSHVKGFVCSLYRP